MNLTGCQGRKLLGFSTFIVNGDGDELVEVVIADTVNFRGYNGYLRQPTNGSSESSRRIFQAEGVSNIAAHKSFYDLFASRVAFYYLAH